MRKETTVDELNERLLTLNYIQRCTNDQLNDVPQCDNINTCMIFQILSCNNLSEKVSVWLLMVVFQV